MQVDNFNFLLQQAQTVRENAYVPYSQFAVGAAIQTDSGTVFTGCNVENASYGLTNCAERSAVFRMIASGERKIRAIAVIADAPRPIAPCGACRQVLSEFGSENTIVLLANVAGERLQTTLGELLPYAFVKEDLNG
ncbi:cytidine deaminase [Sulfoacidibacillus thermotolerans]|uniref:Cytidine deaminase n=1 Tax=Sulfoacidibacillus thermotolerans TaxID=1765684 RepID=A0A2U3D6H5_SULT2|nr:cytidine deaminase [Sulfoacidibacillus thermotolerans]